MYSNDDLINIGEDVVGSIDIAISEVYDIEEYKELQEALEEVKELAKKIRDVYMQKGYEEELAERNAEYLDDVRC